MLPVTALVFLLAIGFAQAPAKQSERPASEPAKVAPELARLDLVLSLAQEARQEGRLTPERYDEFLKRFRVEFNGARAATPPSPAAAALTARILARLGESQQAEAVLGPALEANPDDSGLRVALGHVRFEAGDYAAALAQAEAVLKRDPDDKQAAALKRFSMGRSKGTTAGAASLPAAGLEEASILSDPRIVTAARGALARKSAIGYADEAMRRLKIEDPQAALRYLAMAEAVDPGFADIPMQQGFAHRQLREHAAAVERFARAETLWRAQGTPRADEAAAMARKLGAEQAEALAGEAASSEDAPNPQEHGMPLWPVGAALIAVGLVAGGGYQITKSRSARMAEDGLNPDPQVSADQARRNFVNSAVLIGTPIIIAGLVFGGPMVWRAAAPVVGTALRGGQHSLQRVVSSGTGAINPSSVGSKVAPQVRTSADEATETVRQVVLKKGEILNRVWHSDWTRGSKLSGPEGYSYCRGACLPINARSAVEGRGLNVGVINNARSGALYRVTDDIVVTVRRSIGGYNEEILLQGPADAKKLELINSTVSIIPPGP